MTDLRELLTAAVPDPPPSGDLVERVGALVRRRRRRRTTATMGVAAVMAALAVAVPSALVPADHRPAASEFSARPTDPALCPAPYKPSWRTGDPVPQPRPKPQFTDVPVGAALCRYQDGSQPVSRIEIGPGAADVLDALDRLPEPATSTLCAAVFHDTYQVVFSFENRDLVVHLDDNCWFLSYDGHWRAGDAAWVLDEFAAAYRVEGGDYPAPPWVW